MKYILSLFLVFVTTLIVSQNKFSTAGFYQVENSQRKVYNFNPGWRFYKGDVTNAEKANFDDSNWEAANLPHGLEILPENASGGRNYQGKAWYRKVFELENTNSSDKVFLYFEAVMGASKVWVNGQLVAEHYGGYLPFAADISKALIKNKKNVNVRLIIAKNSHLKTLC